MADQTQGNGAPGASQGDDAPKYVTEEQLNKAITARFTDFSKKSDKTLADLFASFKKEFTELLPKQPEPGAAGGASDPKSIQEHPEFKGLQKQLKDLEERARKAEERTATEERARKDLALRQNVMESLAGANVKDAVRARHAASFLIREGLVKWNESGDALVFVDGKDGEVDFETGFKGWLKSEDAKLYLPSPDASATPPRQQTVPRVLTAAHGVGSAPPNQDDLTFDEKLGNAQQQLAKLGIGLP